MNIIDLDFLDRITGKASIIGSQGVTSDQSQEIQKVLENLTGQFAGLVAASFNVIAQGNGNANTSLDVDLKTSVNNRITIQLQSASRGYAVNPGG